MSIGITELIRRSNKEHWKDGISWLSITVVFTLMPVWLGALALATIGQWPGLLFFLSHGEFYIFSASLLTSVMYIIYNKFKINSLFVTSIILIVVSAALYTIMILKQHFHQDISIDVTVLAISTVVLSLTAVLVAYFSKVFENVKQDLEPEDLHEERRQKLESDFEELRSKENEG